MSSSVVIKLKKIALKNARRWHNKLAIVGGIVLVIFCLSGLTHIIMIWSGPKQSSYFPPIVKLKAEMVSAIPKILDNADIKEAIVVKIISSKEGGVLQVTESNNLARRYFNLTSYQEIDNYDQQHAVWLARYYTGKYNARIKSVIYQKEFDNSYPWVNRLLPVYRVVFDTEDNLTAFIYTEINALASLTNSWKTLMQSIFRALHTWSWLDSAENIRVIVMSVFLILLIIMVLSGIMMIFYMKGGKNSTRRLHRMVSYVVWVPLLAFSISGLYHLLQNAHSDNHVGLQLGAGFKVNSQKFGDSINWVEMYDNMPLNAISVVQGAEKKLMYRLGLSVVPNFQITRSQVYDGIAVEEPSIYIDSLTGKKLEVTDLEMVVHYANQYANVSYDMINSYKRITKFGIDYDFRNKRLPVWQLDTNSELQEKLFIDPITGIIVDRMMNLERYESYSFSFLHKWNFFTPVTGRKNRDIIMTIILGLILLIVILGFMILFNKRNIKDRL